MYPKGLVWAVQGGVDWKIKRPWYIIEKENSSIVEEKVENMTSLPSEEEYNSLTPDSLVSLWDGSNPLPFSLVLLAFFEVLSSLLHSRLFSG